MRDSASLLDEEWSTLVRRFSVDIGIDLDVLAKSTKALRRRRGVRDGSSLLRLALARGPGGMSSRQAAAWAHLTGVAELTDPSLHDRLHGSCDFLSEIVSAQLRHVVPGPSLTRHARPIRVSDGSCISKPGSRGTDWRVHGVYDLGAGGFSHLELTDAHGGEALDRGKGIAGEIRIADRGYSTAKALVRFMSSVKGGDSADYIVRLRWSSLRMKTPAGAKFDLITHLKSLPAEQGFDDVSVLIQRAGAGGKRGWPARIVIARKTEEAAAAERRRLVREAGRRGKQLDPRSLIAAGFVMLATSLPAEDWLVEEVLKLYRLRWQIELAFKRLKSLLRIDRLPAKTAKGARSWIYAHLILALATDADCQEFLESSP